jgi:hypothetical protein
MSVPNARITGMRRCPRCKLVHPLTNYYKAKDRVSGYRAYCKPCTKEIALAYHAENPDKRERSVKRANLKRWYGLTYEEYEELRRQQGDACAICRKAEAVVVNGAPRLLSVDHDHRTGQVRGLLCSNCNRAVGNLQDDPALCRAAAEYLEFYRSQLTSP